MNPVLPLAVGIVLHALAQGTIVRKETGPILLKSDVPFYDLTLPVGYEVALPVEDPPRYLRSAGREPWAKVNARITAMAAALPQNPTGVTAEDIAALVAPPPNATWTFCRKKWKDLEIGVIEYRAVVNDLPVLGLSTILPLARKGLRITVYAADPLEKEVRDDFELLMSGISKTETNWFTDEALGKIAAMEKVTLAGGVLAGLYPVAWAVFFRGRPLSGHWLRTGWLLIVALLLFIPISSPAPSSMSSNLLVNALIPVLYVMLAVRRLKLGIESD